MELIKGCFTYLYSGFLRSMLIVLFFSTQAFAQKNSAEIKFNKNELSLVEVIEAVKTQSEYSFLYSNSDLKNLKNVKLKFSTYKLNDLLKEVFSQVAISYSLDENLIILTKKSNASSKKSIQPKREISKRTITGQVVDVSKMGLPGVSIIVDGTLNGTISDYDGNFTISVPDVGTTKLKFSFMGMETQYIPIANKSIINVEMKDAAQQIEEVVVKAKTGYNSVDRKLFTGSAQTLKAEEALASAGSDVGGALQGKVAGVQVSNVSSSFGAAPVITIRGNSSINGTNKPLWVVDGVELEDLVSVSADDLTSGNINTILSSGVAGLNPDDIESFNILKDVSATALYGAKAMNGVIVITTKEGKKGRVNLNYSSSFSIKEKPNYSNFDLMTSGEEMSIYRELEQKGWLSATNYALAQNYGAMGKMYENLEARNIRYGKHGTLAEDFLEQYGRANTDWFDLLFTNGFTQQHSLSMSGGDDKTSYYASLSLYDDLGYTIADNVSKYTFSTRLSYKPIDQLKIGFKLTGNFRDQRLPGTSDRNFNSVTGVYSRDFDISPFSYALNTSRSIRAYDQNGQREYFRRSYAPFNILHELENNFVDVTVQDITAQFDLEYKYNKDLIFKAVGQTRRATTLNQHTIHETSNQAQAYRADDHRIVDYNTLLFTDPDQPNLVPYTILPSGGFLKKTQNRLEHTYVRSTLSWNPRFGTDHSVSVFSGAEMNYTNRYYNQDDIWGISFDKGNIINQHDKLSKYFNASGQSVHAVSERRERRLSAFTNWGYTYQGKYIINGTVRLDGSNQLGSSPQARWLPSWNVSGAWNMHSESFIKRINFIDRLKLKSSYGLNGIMGPGSSAELAIYTSNTVRPSDNESYNYIAALQNDDLTWEKMYELNLALEFSLFKGILSGEIGHYRRKSIDLIDYVTTSGEGGHSLKLGNIGNMDSDGYEFSLTTKNIKTKDFSWNTSFNVNFHNSEITKLEGFASIANAISNTGAPVLGYPQRGLFSVKFAGLNDLGIPTFYDQNNKIITSLNLQSRENLAKVLKYEGSLEPTSYGGITNTLSYNNFSLKIGIVYKYGNKIRLNDAFSPTYTDYDSFSKELVNRWRASGDEKKTTVPAILARQNYQNLAGDNAYVLYNKSSERVARGDFIRLKDISLSYKFSKKHIELLGLNSASIKLLANNVALLYSDSKLRGIDPEFFSSGGVSLPPARMYKLSFNIGF